MRNDNDSPWQTKDSRITYQNPWVTVREDKVITPGGTDGIYGVIEAKSGVFIIALTDSQTAFLAQDLHKTTAQLEPANWIRAVKTVTLQELHALIDDGSFRDGQSLAALTYFERWYEKHGPEILRKT